MSSWLISCRNTKTEIPRTVKRLANETLALRKLAPVIPVAATDEAASQMDGVVSSGFTDTELESRVSSTLEDLANDNPVSNAEDVAGTSRPTFHSITGTRSNKWEEVSPRS